MRPECSRCCQNGERAMKNYLKLNNNNLAGIAQMNV